jgi:hypothetical protein
MKLDLPLVSNCRSSREYKSRGGGGIRLHVLAAVLPRERTRTSCIRVRVDRRALALVENRTLGVQFEATQFDCFILVYNIKMHLGEIGSCVLCSFSFHRGLFPHKIALLRATGSVGSPIVSVPVLSSLYSYHF